jgi:DMSO/TMAO reductase YedYZ molybdopterin-dependent catalytic subunit
MKSQSISRRTLLKGVGAPLVGLSVLSVTGARAFGQNGGEVIPWLDQPPPNPVPDAVGNLLKWEELDSRLTPVRNFFWVQHYERPSLDAATWRLDISGLVARPRSLTLAELKTRRRQEVEFTLECSGNTGFPFNTGAALLGNARWAGARLAPLLEEANLLEEGTEVVFWGADRGTVTIRDNAGILSGGRTGSAQPDAGGGLDLTITEQFARSMSVSEALHRDNLLCYEMNGEPLPPEHGYPVRLIAPGWYGVANVKWLTRIDILNQRFAGHFMARDYVSVREQQQGDQTTWTFTTVSHTRLKSAPAKVMRINNGYRVMGVAWGAPIASVEVQIDEGPWMPANLDSSGTPDVRSRRYAWRFWTFEWPSPVPGEHTVRSRAFDSEGNVQPAPNDKFLASKRTYWESNGQLSRRILLG